MQVLWKVSLENRFNVIVVYSGSVQGSNDDNYSIFNFWFNFYILSFYY